MFGLTPYFTTTSRVNPFREMDELEKSFFGPLTDIKHGDLVKGFRTDISDNGDSFLLESELPGFSRDNISLDLDGDTLTITAERKDENESDDKKTNYLHRERFFGKYSRAFDVSSVDVDKITAKYEDGVLKVTLPKKQEEVPSARKIDIA